MSIRTLVLLLICGSACGGRAVTAPPPAAPVTAAPEPTPAAAEVPATVAMAKPEAAPPAPAAPGACGLRKVSFTLARATGMGSYITTLSCSGALFTVTSDRATPDGREIKSAFSVAQADWEKAWK